MFRYFINDIELDINDISSLEIEENVINIFPEVELVFQDTTGTFSEFNPMINDSLFSIVRAEDNAIEYFKIASIKETENRGMTDITTGSNYILYRLKACYINKEKSLYSVGRIINATADAPSVLKTISNSLGMRFVNKVGDERIYDYYTIKVSHYNQLQMLVEQINDSWTDRKCVLVYTLFSNALTLVDIETELTSKQNGLKLVDTLTLSNSMDLDYLITNNKAISGYSYDSENFANYDIPLIADNSGAIEIYSNMIDQELHNSLEFYLHSKSFKVNLNFNTLVYNLGTKIDMYFSNRANKTYNSTNELLSGKYFVTSRKTNIVSSGAGIQVLTIANPFLK